MLFRSARVAVICGSDESYGEIGEAVAGVLKQAGATAVVLAGRPKTLEGPLRAAGVDELIYAGVDAPATLAMLQRRLGVSG